MKSIIIAIAAITMVCFGVSPASAANASVQTCVNTKTPQGQANLKTCATYGYDDAGARVTSLTISSGKACSTVTVSHGHAYYTGVLKVYHFRDNYYDTFPIFTKQGCMSVTYPVGFTAGDDVQASFQATIDRTPQNDQLVSITTSVPKQAPSAK